MCRGYQSCGMFFIKKGEFVMNRDKTMSTKKLPLRKKSLRPANWQFWAIIALPLIWLIIFCYVPMSGIVLAFKN